MIRLALLRHGPTDWNAERRLQGRADLPLSAAGRIAVARRRIPAELAGFRWLTSPLLRARETARLLGVAAEVEPALIEMDYGGWEGRTLAALRAEDPDGVAANEARGLDLRPPGGESPRDVQVRLAALAGRLPATGADVAAVTHKGVIRAALALAMGWDMTGKPPVRLDWSAAHLFLLEAGGRWSLVRPNLPLAEPAPEPTE